MRLKPFVSSLDDMLLCLVHTTCLDHEKRKKYTKRQGKKPRLRGWASTHTWQPILEPSFSKYFDLNCNQYSHYLDTVLNKIEPFHDESTRYNNEIGMTCLDNDLYLPRGLYSSDIGLSIIFDSGCSVAVSPSKEDFGDILVPSSKTMLG